MSAFETMQSALRPLQQWYPKLSSDAVRDQPEMLSAISALTAASLETRKILARYRHQGATGARRSAKLVDMWKEAGLKLIKVDGELAKRCLLKADYWADPTNWTTENIQEAAIVLDDVFEEGLKLISNAATQTKGELDLTRSHTFGEEDLGRVTVGILTALPKELAAMKRVLCNGNEVTRSGKGSGRRYWLANVASSDGKVHIVAIAQSVSMGNNISAVRATQLLEHCPNAAVLLMVGIAGGIPNVDKADEHVRLGDIVVSSAMGVVQYDLVKRTDSFEQMRHPPRPPSAELVEAIHALEIVELEGNRPWDLFIAQVVASLGWPRPSEETDKLTSARGRGFASHPFDPERRPDLPKIHRGPIASANKLLKDPKLRDALRDQFGVKAVEMETSGVADATWLQDRGYLAIRGICDYCDKSKGDVWQKYAAIVAAAYARSILEHFPAVWISTGTLNQVQTPLDFERLHDLIHELDTRRVFYEVEENFRDAVDSVLSAREEMRTISRGPWTDAEAEGWAKELQNSLAEFLTRVGKPGSRGFKANSFYRYLERMRDSVNRTAHNIIRKYPTIRVSNLPV